MFLDFFRFLKESGMPLSIREYLDMLGALQAGVGTLSVERFYFLSRTALVKHEQHLDRYDLLFGAFFGKIGEIDLQELAKLPGEWLEKNFERLLSDEEKAQIEALGGLEKLMERMQQLLDEQKERHEGGNKWIGTGGTSPFGAYGYNPEGIRMGQHENRNRRAVKVWDKRVYRNLDDGLELDTRSLKMALKQLRLLTREGRDEELDLDKTIDHTTRNAGYLDIEMRPSRRNNVKVLLFFDVGGSMDEHIESCERLFSAARHEFKHLEYYYFHNCPYEAVWKDNRRRWEEKIPTFEVLNRYNSDYKVIFVGDASMAPYELTHAGGSVEHQNDEAGLLWLERIKQHFPDLVWLNPTHIDWWRYSASGRLVAEQIGEKMFPLTLNGIGQAMKALKNRKLTFDWEQLPDKHGFGGF